MTPAFSLQGKRILVTGGSSGIGRSCAIVASRLGANVAIVGRKEDELARTLAELAPEGQHVSRVQDLTNYAELEGMVSGLVSEMGPLDGFIHSAGLGLTLPLRSTTTKQLEKVFAINVYAGIELCRLLSARNRRHEAGASFVLISSIMGLVGEPGKVGYCCSKGALIAAAKAMAVEMAGMRIRVNCVLPAVVETEMAQKYFETAPPETRAAVVAAHPLGLGTPEDVAHACAFLLADASRWITGTSVIIDGGYSAR
jgi:NAD(P)-dependent dehydrogenase (short-subunit alcohol dehydrogenase family)